MEQQVREDLLEYLRPFARPQEKSKSPLKPYRSSQDHLHDAHNMSTSTSQRAEECGRQLLVKTRELGQAQDRCAAAQSKLETVNAALREADRKMAGIQYSLEERASLERKYKKQIGCLKEKVSHEELRSSRDEEALVKLKQRMEMIGMRRKAKEEEKKKG